MSEEKSGVASNVISLPKGGGSIQGLGQAFQPALNNGTGSYQIPIDLPAGIHNMTPNLALSYSTVGGNGPFGMGWNVGILRIDVEVDYNFPGERAVEPSYTLSGSDRLVPIGGDRYRPLLERAYARIIKYDQHWEVTTKNGVRFLLGETPNGRIEHAGKTYAWLVERAIDTYGHEIRYTYRRDGNQLYPEGIRYGLYRIQFEYEIRPDRLSDRRRGFTLETNLRCTAIHVFLELNGSERIRTYSLVYQNTLLAQLSLLTEVRLTAYRSVNGVVEEKTLPPVSFNYSRFEPDRRKLRSFTAREGAPPPPALDSREQVLIDLTGGALPGVLEISNGTFRYWRNRGRLRWSPPRQLREAPAVSLTEPATWFLDMEGNGTVDLALLSDIRGSYYPNTAREAFGPPIRYREFPQLNFDDPNVLANVRFMDLNHDRVIDMLYSEPHAFYAFINKGREGWTRGYLIPRQHDLDAFPDIFFADEHVRLADMTGDGIQDIVRVLSGRVEYWPYLGAAVWGRRIIMQNAPNLPPNWRPEYLFLSDINGDGVADLIYVDNGTVYYAINRQGRSFSDAQQIGFTPSLVSASVQMADMTGDGLAGILWSFNHDQRRYAQYRYLDFESDEGRPYLMTKIDNHLGLVTEISYATSTDSYIAALEERRDWQTFLPIGIITVSRIVSRDAVSGVEHISDIRYFDGHYDGQDRAFCGFGKAEMINKGDDSIPDLLVRHYFHHGNTEGITDEQEKARARALRQLPYRKEYFGLDGSDVAGQPYKVEDASWEAQILEQGTDDRYVAAPRIVKREVYHYDRTNQPRIIRNLYEQDAYGNIIREEKISDPPYENAPPGTPLLKIVSETLYAENVARWIHDLPARITVKDGNGQLIYAESRYYDGNPYVGLPLRQVEQGSVTRQEQFAITETQATALFPNLAQADWVNLGYTDNSEYGLPGYSYNRARFKFNSHGNIIGKLSPMGFETTIDFDPHNLFPRCVTNPLGHFAEATYDYRIQKPVIYTDENRLETTYNYDPIGRLTSLQRPGDNPATPGARYIYHDDIIPAYRLVTELHDAATNKTVVRREYVDGSGQPFQMRQQAPDSQVRVSLWLERNRHGLVKSIYQPFFSNTFDHIAGEWGDPDLHINAHFDALGRPLGSQYPNGSTTRITYTPWQISYYDTNDTDDSPDGLARGHFNTPRVEKYDAWLRMIEVAEIANGVTLMTRYHYDEGGKVTQIIDAAGRMTLEVQYDLAGRKLTVNHIDTGLRRYLYNAEGNIVWEANAKGETIHRDYDQIDRLRMVRYNDSNGAPEETYHYDIDASLQAGQSLVGRLAWVQDRSGELHFSYDSRGNIERRTKIFSGSVDVLPMRYQYNDRDQLKTLTYPNDRTVSYGYDDGGFLNRIEGAIDEIHYNAAGQKIREKYANQVVNTQQYDPQTLRLHETRTYHEATGQVFRHLRYTYDPGGNLINLQNLSGNSVGDYESARFSYDSLYRLTQADGTDANGAYAHAYSYDRVSNHQLNQDFSNDPLIYDNGAAGNNRLTGRQQAGGIVTEYQFDANGNMISSPLHQELNYDPAGRLHRVVRRDGTVIELGYDFTGQRAFKRVTQGEQVREYFYLDGFFEIEAGVLRQIVKDPLFAVEQQTNEGERAFLHRDFRHSTVLLTDALAGDQERGRFAYYPFGSTSFSQGTLTPARQFIGQLFDPDLELYYFRSRYYDPQLGRFIQPDPMLAKYINGIGNQGVFQPGNLNLYVYGYNNPLAYVDPSGELAWFIPIIIGFVVGAYVGGVVSSGSYAPWEWSAKDWGWAVVGGLIGAALGFGSYLLSLVPGTIGGISVGGLLSSSYNLGLLSVTGSLLSGERDVGNLAKMFGVGFFSGLISGSGAFGLAYTGWLGRYATQIISTGVTNALSDWVTTGRVDRFRFGLHGLYFSTNFRDFSFDGFNSVYWISQGVTLLNGLLGYAMNNGGLGWGWDTLSITSHGSVVGWFSTGGLSIYSVLDERGTNIMKEELTHLWQARFVGEIWFIHYLFNSLTTSATNQPWPWNHHYEIQGGKGFY